MRDRWRWLRRFWWCGGFVDVVGLWVKFSSIQRSSRAFSEILELSLKFPSIQWSSRAFSEVLKLSVKFSSFHWSFQAFSEVLELSVKFSSFQWSSQASFEILELSVKFSSFQSSSWAFVEVLKLSVKFSSVQSSSRAFKEVPKLSVKLSPKLSLFEWIFNLKFVKLSLQHFQSRNITSHVKDHKPPTISLPAFKTSNKTKLISLLNCLKEKSNQTNFINLIKPTDESYHNIREFIVSTKQLQRSLARKPIKKEREFNYENYNN
jgi:hypothetical protein